MKKFLILTILPLFALAMSAQNIGTEFFLLGEYKAAKEFFNNHLANNPEEANFFLGEIAFLEGDVNAAKAYYDKGLAANPESVMNKIGLVKLTVKANPKEAGKEYKDIAKQNKKDAKTHLLIARAYFDAGDKSAANDYLEKARKIDKKNPELYILQGDMTIADNPGQAAGFYDQAVYFDPNFTLGYIKSSKVYAAINTALAIDKLEKVIQVNPDYKLAYKYLGEANIKASSFQQAADAYAKYFSFGDYSLGDIINYSSVLFSQGRFEESVSMIQTGLKRDPNNYILHRLWMFNLADMKEYGQGLEVAEKFFTLPNENPHIIADYTTYAKILKELKQFDKALEYFHKAEEVAQDGNPSQLPTIYSEMSGLYKSARQYDLASFYQEKYMELQDPTKVSMLDFYDLGNMFYEYARRVDSTIVEDPIQLREVKELYVHKADSIYDVMIERIPDNYLGYQGKARAHSVLDPESTEGIAKPYYEKLLEVLLAQDDPNKNALIETYSYLGYFYYLKDDREMGIPLWKKLLELDPTNQNATLVLDSWK